MKQYVLVVLFVVLMLSGCGSSSDDGIQKEVVHMVIDDSVIDAGDTYQIIEPVWWKANIYEGEEAYSSSLVGFTVEQRYIFAIEWYFVEVNNGGHDQFYFNDTGIVWKDALTGFRESGFDEAASALEESTKRLGGNPSLNRETRQNQLETYNPVFDDLDEIIWGLSDTDPSIIEYINSNRSAFYFKGDVTRPIFPEL